MHCFWLGEEHSEDLWGTPSHGTFHPRVRGVSPPNHLLLTGLGRHPKVLFKHMLLVEVLILMVSPPTTVFHHPQATGSVVLGTLQGNVDCGFSG